jgi:hypothetical protein
MILAITKKWLFQTCRLKLNILLNQINNLIFANVFDKNCEKIEKKCKRFFFHQ